MKKMNKTQRIKVAITIAFIAGTITGRVIDDAGELVADACHTCIEVLQEQEEPCYPVKCTHYDREVMGGAIVYEKICCCGTHGHDCSSY